MLFWLVIRLNCAVVAASCETEYCTQLINLHVARLMSCVRYSVSQWNIILLDYFLFTTIQCHVHNIHYTP